MSVIGIVSSVNLVAGAGILGNVGGTALAVSTALTNSISSYNSVPVVSQFNDIADSGYVSINIVADSFPALTGAIPTAYQSSLGSASMTSTVSTEANNILGNGDLGQFEMVLGAAQSLVSQTNRLINSSVNAAQPTNTIAYTTQDNLITGGFSGVTQAFAAFGRDLLHLGVAINLKDLNNLGSPVSLLRQINALSGSWPELNTKLIAAGIPQYLAEDPETANFSDLQQRIIYLAMTEITGNTLTQILKILRVTTPGIQTLADLLNPVKIFPTSFNTLTMPTKNGLRGIYINSTGAINTSLATQLPPNILSSYAQLRQIIPSDQALANKALQNSLEQIKTIFDAILPTLATVASELESNVGLNAINALTGPLPANVLAYYTQTLASGTGPNGTLLLADVIGSIVGWNINNQLANTVTILNTMTSEGDFVSLTNTSTGLYPTMTNTKNGNYTGFSGPPANVYVTTIPSGRPGAGSYTGNTAGDSISDAFVSGLNPAMVSIVNSIVAANPTQVANTTAYFNTIGDQLVLEQNNLAAADVVFANLQAGLTPWGLVYNLNSYGLDTAEGGAAYIFDNIAVTANISGQAVVSTMREARNQARLNAIGIGTDITISQVTTEPQANLGTTQYTVAQATSQKII